MKFCSVINCMDGRVQLPVIEYLQRRFDVPFVDTITEPGPNRIVAEQSDPGLLQSILARLKISIEKHHSIGVAIAGHHDCAGNPVPKDEQILQIRKACDFLRAKYPELEIIGLWVDENGQVNEIT